MLSDGRRIVDSFLFSEPHELDVLLCKLHAEDPRVDEWVAVEGAYTFRGEHKGLCLRKHLEEDERFAPFRHKFTVVEQRENMLRKGPCEKHFFEVEFASRELSREYILSKYGPRDLVTCSDVDEMLDFSDEDRCQRLDNFITETAARNQIAWVGMRKCWYDFDNFSDERKWFPLGPISRVRDEWRQRQAANLARPLDAGANPLAFEYSYCFSRDAIVRKLSTFSHDGFTTADVDRALAGNYWVKSDLLGQRRGDRPEDNFWTEPLTEKNSTRYVRENISWLKTWNTQRKEK
jgi:hypothetical protein